MKQTEAERLAEQALNSLNGIQAAPVNEFLYTRIRNRMETRRKETGARISLQYRMPVLILLLAVSVNLAGLYLLRPQHNAQLPQQNSFSSFAQEYQLMQASYNY